MVIEPIDGPKAKNGFTLVELLVVIGIIAVLLALLMPSLNKARESAKQVVCLSQLRQISLAASNYLIDNKGVWVRGRYYSNDPATRDSAAWFSYLTPYIDSSKRRERVESLTTAQLITYHSIWRKMTCPSEEIVGNYPYAMYGVPLTYAMHAATDHGGGLRAYGLGYGLMDYFHVDAAAPPSAFGRVRRASQIRRPAEVLAFTDGQNSDYVYANFSLYEGTGGLNGYPIRIKARHKGGYPATFVDGHGEMVPEKRMRDTSDPMWKTTN